MSQTETGLHLRDMMTRMCKPANVTRTAERNTKIHLYIRKSFKCLLMIFLPLIQQCLSSVHGADWYESNDN